MLCVYVYMSEQSIELRMKRGQELLQKGATITKINEKSYNIDSLTSNSVYEINNLENRFVCSCPDFQYREVKLCKHIACLQIWLTNKVEEKPKVFADDAIQCDECGSIRIIKYGFDCGKQTCYCKDCHKKLRNHSILRKVKFTPELITLCLDLYFSGLSLRKISRNISDHFNVDINYSTIYDWIQRYIPQISEYVNSLIPNLSDSWNVDELFVKMKSGEKRKGNANVA